MMIMGFERIAVVSRVDLRRMLIWFEFGRSYVVCDNMCIVVEKYHGSSDSDKPKEGRIRRAVRGGLCRLAMGAGSPAEAEHSYITDYRTGYLELLDGNHGTDECIEYCNGTAEKFVANAAKFAGGFATGELPADVDNMTAAISTLMGASWCHRDETVFKNPDWSAEGYMPDYVSLEVEPSKMNVPQERIMAGIGLCIGLWVRLADKGAHRPVSGHEFAPPLGHCSFIALLEDTGWVDFVGARSMYADALREHALSQTAEGAPKSTFRDAFFGTFRDPGFFRATLEVMESSQGG